MGLKVGSWPGYLDTQNQFLAIFLDGLAEAGAEIVSLDDVEAMSRIPAGVDVVLLHWPQRVFWEADDRLGVLSKMARLVRSLRARTPGVKVVWLAHDLAPHDAAGLQSWLWSPFMAALTSTVDAFLTLSTHTVDVVAESYPRLRAKPGMAVAHPSYPGQVLEPGERRAVRSSYRFGENDLVLGYCGQLRHNKGVDTLARVFAEWDREDARLLIAGGPAGGGIGLQPLLEEMASHDPRLRLDLQNLDPAAFRRALGACDLVVAPFREYLHSGSLVHALSANKPVLTSETPFARDLQERVGPQWVRLFEGPLEVAHLAAATEGELPEGHADIEEFGHLQVGEKTYRWLEGLSVGG